MNEKTTKESLKIRRFQHDDVEACRHLWEELTEWHREIYADPTIGGDRPGLYFDKHLEKVGAHNLLVADLNGRVIGLTGLIVEGADAEVEPVIVSSEFREIGVGRQLIEDLIAYAHTLGIRQLKVRPVGRNEQAIRFFHEVGFRTIGYIEFFQELDAEDSQAWKEGETIADRVFKV